MKKFFYQALMLLVAFTYVACDETKEVSKYDNWQDRNEAFIDSLANVFETQTDHGGLGRLADFHDQRYYVYYKIMEEGDNTKQRPYYNSTVNAYYRGMLIDEAVFALSKDKYYTRLWENLTVFDYNFTSHNPDPEFDGTTQFTVSGVVNGWVAALQWMYPGARWELYIPWQCAYGESGSGEIPGYSTLIFDLELVSVEEY